MDFAYHLEKYLPKEEIDKLIKSFDEEEQKGVILNTSKMSVDTFKNLFPNAKNHPVIPYSFLYKKDEYNLGSNIYHELGAYYIQDPSAMLVSFLLNPTKDDFVLDMCAAPGGKSVGAALLMQNKGQLIANDISRSRLDVLMSNVERMGLSNVVVTSLDFSKKYQNFISIFDKIILDAPCSGSGMFRKMSEMKDDWSIEKVHKYSKIQKELILAAYHMLKEGGELIYSTCSYSFEEDEEVIEYLLQNSDAELINLPFIMGEYRSPKYKETIHLFSSHFKGEGHFIAKIHKPGTLIKSKFEDVILRKDILSKGGKKEVMNFKMNIKLPKELIKFVIRPGIHVSTLIKDKEIPSHAYARTLINDENMVEVSLIDAKRYILGEELIINKKDGYYFPSFNGLTIGVSHVLSNRAKNLYPKGLRKKII